MKKKKRTEADEPTKRHECRGDSRDATHPSRPTPLGAHHPSLGRNRAWLLRPRCRHSSSRPTSVRENYGREATTRKRTKRASRQSTVMAVDGR